MIVHAFSVRARPGRTGRSTDVSALLPRFIRLRDAPSSDQSPFRFTAKTGSPFMDGVACLVLSGRYIGYLPRYFAKQWVDQDLLKPLWSRSTSRHVEVLLVRRKADEVKPAVNLLVEAMINAHGDADGILPGSASINPTSL